VPGGTMGRNLRHGPARPSCRASTAQMFSCWAGLRAQVFGPCSCQPIKHGPDLQLYCNRYYDAVDLSLMTIVASFTPITCIVFVYCYNNRIYNFH